MTESLNSLRNRLAMPHCNIKNRTTYFSFKINTSQISPDIILFSLLCIQLKEKVIIVKKLEIYFDHKKN